MNKTFSFKISKQAGFKPRKWDIMRISSTSQEAIAISEPSEGFCNFGITVYPYKRKKTRIGRWIWFTALKIKIFFGVIKTTKPTN